jgi:hypothetical protein
MTPAQIKRDGARGIKCQLCGAPIGQHCKDGGLDVPPHATRLEAAQRAARWGVYISPETRDEQAREKASEFGYPKHSTGHIALISCCAKKLDRRAPARDLYTSPLFRMTARYVEEVLRVPWFVLSALHRVVHPDTLLSPYDFSMSKMSKREREVWSQRVRVELRTLSCWDRTGVKRVTAFAGGDYLRGLRRTGDFTLSEPLAGKMIGSRLRWLHEQLDENTADSKTFCGACGRCPRCKAEGPDAEAYADDVSLGRSS